MIGLNLSEIFCWLPNAMHPKKCSLFCLLLKLGKINYEIDRFMGCYENSQNEDWQNEDSQNWIFPEWYIKIENSQKLKTGRKRRFPENENSQNSNLRWKFPESKNSQKIKKKLNFWWLPKRGCRGRQPPDCPQGAWRSTLQGSGGSRPLLG